MDVEGAMLLMAVFDYDMVGSNDLCGLCVIPCKRIPRLSGKGSITRPTGPERKNYHLPLFKVQPTAAFRSGFFYKSVVVRYNYTYLCLCCI